MQRYLSSFTLIVIATLALASSAGSQSKARFDLLIANGKVLDGTGNPWFYADIGIKDGKIAAVGRLKGASAKRAIDAAGLVITPGFIDIHSHAGDGSDEEGGLSGKDPKRRAAPNLIAQGVTTVVINQDGRSPWPIREQVETLRKNKIGPNAIPMFGHGTIRRMVMKNDFRRPATDEEIKQLQELARQAMQEGAFGMSAGLEYTPGRWSTTDEVTAIVAAIAPYGGIYISHERSEGSDPMWYWPTQHGPGPPTLLDAVMETIEIGERTGATVIASHVKAKGAHYWGTSHAVIQLIKTARARGVSVWADQYPYNTSGTDGNTVLIPTWVYGAPNEFSQDRDERPNFAELLRQRLTDAADAEKIRIDIAHEIRRRGGPENVVIFDCPDSSWIGKSVAELAKKYGISPVEMALKLQLEGFANRRGGARLRGFSMSEEDVEAYAVQPWTMTSSDAGIALPEDRPVHARFYGTFPRKLRHYAIDRGIMPVESAVRSMTSLPAQVLGLRDRGMIREGFWADVAILNLDRLRDKATFTNPHQYAEGVEYVLVNGQFVVESGKLTWALPGIVMAKSFVLGNEAKKNDQ